MYRMKLDGEGTRTDLGTLNYKSDWEGSAVMFEPGRILLTEALGCRLWTAERSDRRRGRRPTGQSKPTPTLEDHYLDLISRHHAA